MDLLKRIGSFVFGYVCINLIGLVVYVCVGLAGLVVCVAVTQLPIIGIAYIWVSLSVVLWMGWMPYPVVQARLSKTKPKRFAFATVGATAGVLAFVFVGVDRWLAFIPNSWFIPLGWLASVCFGHIEPNGIRWLLAFGAAFGVLIWLVRINRRLTELSGSGEQNESNESECSASRKDVALPTITTQAIASVQTESKFPFP